MAEFGRSKRRFFKIFLKLKHRTTSLDTFSTIMRMLDAKALDQAFGRLATALMSTLLIVTSIEHIWNAHPFRDVSSEQW